MKSFGPVRVLVRFMVRIGPAYTLNKLVIRYLNSFLIF
jgi:hypothetical protein